MLLLHEHSEHVRTKCSFRSWSFSFRGPPQARTRPTTTAATTTRCAILLTAAVDAQLSDHGQTAALVADAAAKLKKKFKAHFFTHLALEDQATLSPVSRKFSIFEITIELVRRIFFMSCKKL